MSETSDKSSPIYFVLEWTPKQESQHEYDLTVTPCVDTREALETVSKCTSPIRCISTANPLTGEGCEQ